MQEDTKNLLQECYSGCKMGVESMRQVSGFAEREKLKELIQKYIEKHEKLKESVSEELKKCQEPEKEPPAVASAFAWFTTEMKLILKDDSSQIAKIMMDGCNMGIQSISKSINDYPEASKESTALAKKLVKLDEDFMGDLKEFR